MRNKHKYKPQWFFSPFGHIQYALIRDLKDVKKLGLKKKMITLGCDANATSVFMSNNGIHAAVVYFPVQELSDAEKYSLIAHEATHVWQEIAEIMGENNPSSEFEAYSIGDICLNLITEMIRHENQ